jgi:hypothetical protein
MSDIGDMSDMSDKAGMIALELKSTIKLIRERFINSTDFDEIHLLTKLLDLIQKDALNLSNELFALHQSAQPKAA